VHQSLVPEEHQVKIKPFLLKSFEELLQDTDIICIHSDAPGHVVRVYHPLVIKEGKHHMLNSARYDFGLNGALCTLFKPLPGLKFLLLCVH
jgi:hypothetical protein